MTETIEITVGIGGTYKVETSGFKGASCAQATDTLLKRLGGQQKQEKKPEFHQHDPSTSHRRGQGA